MSEIAEALDTGKPIVPILLNDSARIPAVLRSYQALDLSNDNGSDSPLDRLVEAINRGELSHVDAGLELSKLRAQERILAIESDAEAKDLERQRYADKDSLIDASRSSAAVFGGAAIGAAIAGPVGGVAGRLVGAGIGAMLTKFRLGRRMTSGSKSGKDSSGPKTGASDA